MIPAELDLHNFLAYRDPGPLVMDGIHIACLAGPNGAGKSSILDAITWCLWGKARSNSADDLIHQGQTEMRVELRFYQGDDLYRAIRQRNAGKRGSSLLDLQAYSEPEEKWKTLAEGTIRETQDRIDDLLRLDYDTFVNSAFLAQGRADEFTTKTPSQRKQILSNILGLDIWELLETRAKDRVREIEKSIQRIDGRLDELERELARREEYQRALQEADAAAAGAARLLEDAESTWSDLEQARADLVRVQREIDDRTRRITSRERELSDLKKEIEALRQRSDRAALEAAQETVQVQIRELEPIESEHERRAEERTRLVEEIANLRGINQALAPETEPLKERAAALEKASEPICPTCGQPLTDEHRQELLAGLHEEVEKRRELYRKNADRIKELEAQAIQAQTALSDLDGKLKSRAGLEKQLGELESGLSHADEAAERLRQVEQRFERWTEELESEVQQRAELEDQAAQTDRALKAATITQKDLDRLRLEKRKADERVGGARQKLAALEEFERQQEARKLERAELAEAQGEFEALREAFGKRGVPAMIIETVVPELERSANELLNRMTDGRLHVRIETQREIKSGDLREALDIIISDELGSRPYELYSGGEAFRINFAIRIALSQLLANRAGAQLRSLFIDEGFGTQDERGREQLVEAINSIQDDFDRILVITHIEELKEAFPHRIEVRKTPEGSVFSLS